MGASTALAVAALAGVAVVETATSTPPAFALTENANGSVTVTLNNIADGIAAPNAALVRHGLNDVVIPVVAGCTAKDQLPLVESATGNLHMRITIRNDPANIPPGSVGFIAAKQIAPGRVILDLGTMPKPAPTCVPDRILTSPQVTAGARAFRHAAAHNARRHPPSRGRSF